MNVYRISGRLRVFVVLFSVFQILIFISFLLIPFITLPSHSPILRFYNSCCTSAYLYYLIPLLILCSIMVGILLLVSVFKRRIIFTNDSIISKDIFSTRQLTFSEVKGFLIKRSVLYVVTNSNNKKHITINLLNLDRSDNLVRNLEMRFANLEYLKVE
ncbi:hypothetical protein EDB96_0102 [Flavobacterium sp. S87F.05.LMB.W.Kidney.N]|nr:hypothetical protein EDB96_0102 [Flavobacterium sp. S87F.05.LMB.W.Kidney.N]